MTLVVQDKLAQSTNSWNFRPPSPRLAFAVIPWVANLYNEAYQIAFGKSIKKWDRAVQRTPREGETAAEVEAAQNLDFAGDDDFEVNIQVDLAFGAGPEEDVIADPPPPIGLVRDPRGRVSLPLVT